MKKQKTAGLIIKKLMELQSYVHPLIMPPTADALVEFKRSDASLMHIPLDDIYAVEGAVFTGKQQVEWIGQLVKRPYQFVIHGDGKYKLHHGDWILLTLGVHVLAYDANHRRLTTRFVPLVYLFCKQHESAGACTMLVDGVNKVALKYFDAALQPGAAISDHSDGFRVAYTTRWPKTYFGQCWPHLIRKFHEGEYCSKTWDHFDEAADHLGNIHLAATVEMRDLLMREYGALWDSWGKGTLRTLWNSYCIPPWDNWSLGLFDCMLATPSQQAEESWHKMLNTSKIPGMFRGSTEYVFKETLPKLVQMDGIDLPTVLNFDVPCVPPAIIEKAIWYVNHQETHVHAFRSDEGDYGYYVLAKDSCFSKITKRLIEMYQKAAVHGERDSRVKHVYHDTEPDLGDVCTALHLVCEAQEPWGVPRCEYNLAELDCVACKGFKGHGICSHVVAVNHILQKVNLRRANMTIGKSANTRPGHNTAKAKPALLRNRSVEPDSSDEELERLLQEGARGK